MNLLDIRYKIVATLDEIAVKVKTLANFVDKNNYISRIAELNQASQAQDFWNDPITASKVSKELKHKQDFVEKVQNYCQEHEDYSSMIDEFLADPEFPKYVDELEKNVEKLYFSTLFSHECDDAGCFLTITAGSGGMEAQDWASMLFQMYYNFAKQSGEYKAEILEYTDTEAGLKSGVIKIEGHPGSFPYGMLKGENGVHRLVRPSPFNANNNRHTSFSSVLVTPVVDDTITVQINESDLRIDTYRASGAGGQHVNKTDSAVRITHLPTGIVVQSQNDRSQHRNKSEAMKMLKSRLYALAEQQKKAANAVEKDAITWGNQIRSYVLDDSRIKDLRTGYESHNPTKVLSGDILDFLNSYINMIKKQ